MKDKKLAVFLSFNAAFGLRNLAVEIKEKIMATRTNDNRTYYINPSYLSFVENSGYGANLIQVSASSSCYIRVFIPDVIKYDADGNYRKWKLTAYNNKFPSNERFYIYARLEREGSSALLVYSPFELNIDGTTAGGGTASESYYFIGIGEVSGTDGYSIREITYDTGRLESDQVAAEGTELNEMWELEKNPGRWLIRAKHWLAGFTIKGFLTFVGGLIFKNGENEKMINDVKRSVDSDSEFLLGDDGKPFFDESGNPVRNPDYVPVSDFTVPTTKYAREMNDDKYLRKDQDDATPHNLGVGKNLKVGENLSVGEDIISEKFAEGTQKGGYAIRQTNDGAYEAEVDNIVARILAKTYDLLVQNHATFVGDLTSEEFISGFLGGKGWSIRMREGKSVAELDELIVRGSMRVYEFIISQLLGENDNRIFTGMMEVDHYDAETGKIYLKTDNGKLYNPFRVDDVVIVQQYGEPNEDNGFYVIKQYELIVTEAQVGNKSDGESRLDWITFRDFTTTVEGGNESLIAERDTLVRVDNLTNQDRKGIIQMMAAGKDTPYMDFIYGYKTDPDNSLKGRLGNLGGVWNELFGKGGWLRGFGAYLTNLYAVGEFVIAHTGENVSDTIEIAKGQFRTNFRQTTYDLSEEDNFFTNAALTNNCEHWILGSEDGTEYFMVDGLPQFFNFDVYATEDSYAGLVEWKGRDMLRLNKSAVRQLNPLIRKAGTHKVYKDSVMNEDGTFTDSYDEVPDTLYLSVRLYVAGTGNVEIGFIGEDGAFIDNDFHVAREMVADEDAYNIKLAGTWDGVGDFCITSTGDVYVDMLSLTDKPLENFKTETWSAIEQNAEKIRLTAGRIQASGGSLADLEVKYNQIKSQVSNLSDEFGVTQKELEDFQNDAEKEFDKLTQDILGLDTWKSELVDAGLNSTMIKQTDDTIAIVAGAFEKDENGNYVLASAAGSLVYADLEKAMNEQFATLDDKYAKIGTYVEYDPETGEITSEIKLSADNIKLEADDLIEIINGGTTSIVAERININGVFSANQTFHIDENGYMNCSGGRIANFMIVGNDLENFTNNSRIIISNNNKSSIASKKAEIGLSTVLVTGSSGMSSMGLFVDEEVGDVSNIALAVSAKNAWTNIGLLMMGGCIAGLAEKVGHYTSNGSVITREDNVAIVYGARISLPEMFDYDDGHKITVISNYTSSSYIDCSGNNFIRDGNDRFVSITIEALACMQFIYIANWTHQFPIGPRQGCWVKI